MYLDRVIGDEIKTKLRYIDAISIEGPKWCGKSTTASLFAKTIVKLQDSIVFKQYQVFATTNKNDLLDGNKPMLFDEWQKIPEILDFVRTDIDENSDKPDRYILTGSTKPIEDDKRLTETGIIAKIKMRPMSLYESGD